ncbi:MAG: hypothetical protein K8T10_17120 [Candidatus Eremiobacteraeota bacterium]|nr:hypothetical protein [Candidatus Eremiobacteraeota bacterium]
MDEFEYYSEYQDTMEDEIPDTTGETGDESPLSFKLPTVGKPPDLEESEFGEKKKKEEKEKKRIKQQKLDFQQAKSQSKMIIGLSGTFAGGDIHSADGQGKNKVDPDAREMLEYLQESINEYRKYVENIGKNGLAASNLNYYRDDIQDVLDLLKYDDSINLKEYWGQIVKLDIQLRAKAAIYVREIGYNNFKQYQIVNDPPLTRWWWYLNRNVAPPIIKPKFWEIWKKL